MRQLGVLFYFSEGCCFFILEIFFDLHCKIYLAPEYNSWHTMSWSCAFPITFSLRLPRSLPCDWALCSHSVNQAVTLRHSGLAGLPPSATHTAAQWGTHSQVHSALPWLSHWPVTRLEDLPTAPTANFRIHSGKPGFCCMPEPSLSTPAGKAVGNLSHSEWSPPPSTNKCLGILLLTQIESVTSCWQNCLAFSASHKMSSPTPAAEALFCSVQGWVGALEYSQTQSQTSLSFPGQFLLSKQFSIGRSAFCHSLWSSNGCL